MGCQENVAFHPKGSEFLSCYGAAMQFSREERDGGNGRGPLRLQA